ncbi:hypothetical protein CQ052_21920 [Ochrobactrum sp. MYb15]|uniref:DUF2283 domain-containing protein n=1 Tax=Brucella pituitosa TaxID=571256 RepID=UPI000CFCA0E6|nr:hypothetical protein CQZ90_21310 [Ochrobactrum sp. MYb19]PRA60761.1 hypothetical protein CQ053_20925 [Ochrobactrum sp. MYb18]PRA73498.1 hypothetical protein CQ049_20745 [Brucella thiophenivorans]PRA85118.1 hypothetical protein CQ051_21320 [Ochrobactrum sp. MYb14]PRA95020.1 hypothetical protein CQ052_21920 [Ochrobactrum sp. MYb15]
MKIRCDVTVDTAYIDFRSDNKNNHLGFTYCCDPIEVDGQIHLDFDDEGHLKGIEALQASTKLPSDLLK